MERFKIRLYHFLRWSEKYTKTDMIYLSRSGFWLTLFQVVSTVTSFILSILFARYLSKDVFGIYKYIISIAGFVSAFSLTGMNTAITRAVSQGRDGTFATSLPVQLRWTIAQFIITASIAAYYFFKGNYPYAIAFSLIAVCGPISTVTNSFASYLHGKQDFKTYALYSTYSSIIYFCTIAAATLWLPTVVYLIAAYYLSTTLTNAYFCWRTLKRFPAKNPGLDPIDIRYAKHLSIMTLVGSAANQIDSIIVYQLLGPTQLAIYAFSTIIPDRIRSIFSIVMSAALPKLSMKGDSAMGDLRYKIFQMIIIACVVIFGYILTAPIFYQFFFPQYSEAVWYSQVYAISLLILPSFISLPSLYAQKKENALYIINIGLPVLKILISFFTILWWGLLGAVLAKVSHFIIHMIISSYYVTVRK